MEYGTPIFIDAASNRVRCDLLIGQGSTRVTTSIPECYFHGDVNANANLHSDGSLQLNINYLIVNTKIPKLVAAADFSIVVPLKF